jgi:ubiquinone biosynthesis accessory factor UbiK
MATRRRFSCIILVRRFICAHRSSAISHLARGSVVCPVINSNRPYARHAVEIACYKNNVFEEPSDKIDALLAQSPVWDVEKNLRAPLSIFFVKTDPVTRAEFEVQARLLARSREKID